MNNENNRYRLQISRRNFIVSGLSTITLAGLISKGKIYFPNTGIKAIAFDAFAVFDPRPVFEKAKQLFGEKGPAIVNQWRISQFEYTWLRTVAGQYKNFWEVTKDALSFATRKNNIQILKTQEKQIMEQYLQLDIWPDVRTALEALSEKGIRLSFLSNMTNEMLLQSMKHSRIDHYFEKVISTDSEETYKPDAKAYELGYNVLKLKKQEILFVAFAGWDACGAKWFGYPTFWMNRMNAAAEELEVYPDATGIGMTELLHFIE